MSVGTVPGNNHPVEGLWRAEQGGECRVGEMGLHETLAHPLGSTHKSETPEVCPGEQGSGEAQRFSVLGACHL